MYLIGISKGYSNAHTRVNRRIKPPQCYYAYQIDENQKIHRQRIPKWKAILFKLFKTKYRRIKFFCEECGIKFSAVVKSRKDNVPCPRCGN